MDEAIPILDMDFVFTPEKIGVGKHRNKLALLNTLPLWYRYGATRIKNNFKQRIKEWFVSEWEDSPYRRAELTFQLMRPNRYKIDSDAPILYVKWLQDVLVEQGYLIDDDQTKIILEPTLLVQDVVETQIRFHAKLYERITMDIDTLILKIKEANGYLDTLFGPEAKYTKANSMRLRKVLTELRHGIPEAKRKLIEEDKHHGRK